MAFIVILIGIALISWYVFNGFMRAAKAKGDIPFGVIIKAVFMVATLIIIANLTSAIVVVPAGSRGVVFNKFHGVNPNPLGEGMNLITPFFDNATIFNVQVQKADVKATAASKDLQDVTTDLVLNFRPKAEAVATIYQGYGLDYVDKVVAPAVQESVKAVVAQYTAEELITKREDVKTKVQAQLAQMLLPANLALVETYMTNFAFSNGFTQAIENKQIAEQETLKQQKVLDRVKIEANQKIAQAQAEAESLRLQKQQITPELLELRRIEVQSKAIEKWNGELPTTMLGGGTVPFVNLDSSSKK